MKKLIFLLMFLPLIACNDDDAEVEINDAETTTVESSENTSGRTAAEEDAYNRIAVVESNIKAKKSSASDEDAAEKYNEALEKLEEAREKLVDAEEKRAKGKYDEAAEKVQSAMDKVREAEEKAAKAN